MRDNPFDRSPKKEVDYKQFLKVRIVDTEQDRNFGWRFSVSENFTIFITSELHEHLFSLYGVDPEKTLTEGYIYFDSSKHIRVIIFKPPLWQPKMAFEGTPEELILLQKAVEEMIKDSLK